MSKAMNVRGDLCKVCVDVLGIWGDTILLSEIFVWQSRQSKQTRQTRHFWVSIYLVGVVNSYEPDFAWFAWFAWIVNKRP